MDKSLNQKLAELRRDPGADVFILADARDADMAWGVASPGKAWPPRPNGPQHRSLEEYIQEAREIVEQGLIDILLASVSTMSVLAHAEHRFVASPVTPAIRANDTTDIWLARGSSYASERSRPFSTCTLAEAQFGRLGAPDSSTPAVNLGLYSVTFTNDVERDRETLLAFKQFRADCARAGFRYFLEVFPPNVSCGIGPELLPAYLNDQIARTLAGVAREHRPIFLKIPYLGASWLEELVHYDPSLVIGILGGASGTTFDAFKLVAEAKRHGARAALFGRRIKDAEHPLSFVALLRLVADSRISPEDAVRSYHDALDKRRIPAKRDLAADLELTLPELKAAR